MLFSFNNERTIYMKHPWEWCEDDILVLIKDGVKESIDLEYKSCASIGASDSKKNEISKDVSAFANAAGGTIIYGVVDNNHLPVNIDVGYDPDDISKEWLEQVIYSRIHSKIDGIRINQIEITRTNPGKVIYVVYIPQSSRAPHMASDNKYYKRYNFQSVPMEDYEVRDVMHRLEYPSLQLMLLLIMPQLVFQENQSHSDPIKMNALIYNQSAMPAEYYIVSLFFDDRIKIISTDKFTLSQDNTVITYNNKMQIVQQLNANFGIPGSMPIWQGVTLTLNGSPLMLSLPRGQGEYVLGWRVYSPRMETREHYYIMKATDNLAIIQYQ